MRRIESEVYLTAINTSASFKRRIIHDNNPPEEPEPLHDATLVEDRIQSLKMESSSSKKLKKKFNVESSLRRMSTDSEQLTQQKQFEELIVYKKGKKIGVFKYYDENGIFIKSKRHRRFLFW